MNAIAQLGENSAKQLSAMPASTKLMAGLLIAVAAVCTAWTLVLYDAGDRSYILGVLTREELSKAQTALSLASLDEFEVVGDSRLMVPTAKKAEYLRALEAGDAIPKAWRDKYAPALTPSLFDSKIERELRIEYQRERAFEEILCRRPQIDRAYVEYDQVKSGFAQECTRTCCIHVEQNNLAPIEPSILESIRESATKYFAGLSLDDVSVVDLNTSLTSTESKGQQPTQANPLLQAQTEWEEHYLKKLQALLGDYGQVKIGVSVELDPDSLQMASSPREVPQETQIRSTTRKRVEVQTPARVGDSESPESSHSSSGVLNQPQSIVTRSEETEETKLTQIERLSTAETLARTFPKSVSISVGIPESHYRHVHRLRWQLSHPSDTGQNLAWTVPSEEELSEVRDQVDQAVQAAIESIPIGVDNAVDKPLIRVYSYTDLPAPEIPEADLVEQARVWIADSWTSLVLLGLTCFCLCWMFVWMRTSPSNARGDAAVAAEESGSKPQDLHREWDIESITPSTPPEFAKSQSEKVKQDLSRLVKENPEATKALLKDWMGDAA